MQVHFKESLRYIQNKFPLNNETICNSVWVDVIKRNVAEWENVDFFLTKYQTVSSVSNIKVDDLYEEFCDYQTLRDNEISEAAWSEAKIVDGEEEGNETFHYRIDILWWYLSEITVPGTSMKRFKNLFKLAEIIIVLSHSNAEQEQLFSIVRKNKTDSHSSLKLDGTLSNILAMKTFLPERETPCHKWIPPQDLIESSKKAVKTYNDNIRPRNKSPMLY